jgi:hypothetical protein
LNTKKYFLDHLLNADVNADWSKIRSGIVELGKEPHPFGSGYQKENR